MKPRKSKRIDTAIRIFFTSGKVEGEGTVLDISKEGCRFECETPITMGTPLEVWIFLPNSEWPLEIELAEVRWKKGNVFGVQFLKFRPLQEDRFRKVLQEQKIAQKT